MKRKFKRSMGYHRRATSYPLLYYRLQLNVGMDVMDQKVDPNTDK